MAARNCSFVFDRKKKKHSINVPDLQSCFQTQVHNCRLKGAVVLQTEILPSWQSWDAQSSSFLTQRITHLKANREILLAMATRLLLVALRTIPCYSKPCHQQQVPPAWPKIKRTLQDVSLAISCELIARFPAVALSLVFTEIYRWLGWIWECGRLGRDYWLCKWTN